MAWPADRILSSMHSSKHWSSQHEHKVNALARQVQHFYAAKIPFKIYHGSTNSTRTLAFDKRAMLDTSKLTSILRIDPKERTARVEANVPMDRLVQATLKYGLLPPVVPEFPGITVGGAIQGGAGESSSFRHGCVNATANRIEIILADGSVINTSRTDHPDLFWGMAGACGSLGVVTAAELQLIPAKRYVTVTYLPVHGFAEALQKVQETASGDYDFVDGILFSPDSGVIIAGKLADEPTARLTRFHRPHDEWFYLHAQKQAVLGNESSESIPVADYLFRYDRGAFWMGKHAFDLFGIPFSRANRTLLHGLLSTRRLYHALQASGLSHTYIIQDIALPANKAQAFLQYIDKTFEIYPLWLCPLPVDTMSPLLVNHLKAEQVINIGVWGPFAGSHDAFIAANRDLEQKAHELGGRKWLYAHTYYSPDEFWQIYDMPWYAALRDSYHAETLPTVYDKVHVRGLTRTPSRQRGLWKAMTGHRVIHMTDSTKTK